MKLKTFIMLPFLLSLQGCALFSLGNSETSYNGGGKSSAQQASSVNNTDGTFIFNGSSVSAVDANVSGDLVIPSSFNGQSITTIPSDAFKNCSKIKSIVIPDSITSIAKGAFAGCIQLESIKMPFPGLSRDKTGNGGHLGQIFGDKTYNGGTAVKSNYNTGSYDYNTYYIPSSLRKVEITDATTLVYGAFMNANMLTEIKLNDDIIAVGAYCFAGVNQITTVSLPNIFTIPNSCFNGCTKLDNFTIGNKVTKIESNAFKSCMNLTKINSDVNGKFVIPNNVNEIQDNVFYNCLKVEDITLPFIGNSDSKTNSGGHFSRIFGDSTYTGSTSVKSYYSTGSYDYNTYYIPSGLRSVTITNATHVVYGAFQNVSIITSLKINKEANNSVGNKAFDNCFSPTWF